MDVPVHAEERAAQNHLAIRLQGERRDHRGSTVFPSDAADAAARIEAQINAAVSVQPRDAAARKSADVGEASTDDDLPVGLKHQGLDAKIVAGPEQLLVRSE